MPLTRGTLASCCPQSRWTSCPPSVQPEGPLRHVLRALLGAFGGAILFLGVSHNLPLTLELKLAAGAIFTGLCAVGGACSSFVRCALLLTFPMMPGSRGRTYLLLQLLSILYSGPVQNIQLNVEASALSVSCNLDLQVNHSRLLWRQTILPLISIAEELTGSTSKFTGETMNAVLDVLQTAKSFTFITIILQAVGYLLRYRRDLRFDNVYITQYFRRIEARRQAQGRHCVLPLSKPDRSRFIQPCSPRIHPQEASLLFSGLVQAVSLGLLTLVLVGLDLVLFHVLEIVSRNTITTFNITGAQQVSVRVGGASIMARLLRKTVSAFNSSTHFDIDSSNAACAVTPSALSPSVYLSCAACVLMVALCSILQIYSSRLRRVISASFHPQREKRRVLFLYNLLLQRNRKCSGSNRKRTRPRLNVVCGRCLCCCRPEGHADREEVQYEQG
uniref:Dendritic cell-specific transmembrane protein-like domain-containing protein n=1 Tax=Neogobius melanostomus TaxID=47308 RepID=A0A8C6S8Q1_9GOBI